VAKSGQVDAVQGEEKAQEEVWQESIDQSFEDTIEPTRSRRSEYGETHEEEEEEDK